MFTLMWKDKHVQILKEWKAKCFVHLWLHDKSCYYYLCLNNYLSYPVIIISSIASATLLSSNNDITRYIVGTLSLVSSILTSLLKQIRPGELHHEHAILTRKYHNLIRSIDACLSLTEAMRPAPDVFIEKIGLDIDALVSTQTEAPTSVLKKFERIYGPIDTMLYGEDIVELIITEIGNDKMFTEYKKERDRKSVEITMVNNEDIKRI